MELFPLLHRLGGLLYTPPIDEGGGKSCTYAWYGYRRLDPGHGRPHLHPVSLPLFDETSSMPSCHANAFECFAGVRKGRLRNQGQGSCELEQ